MALTLGEGAGVGLKVVVAAVLDTQSTAEWPARGGRLVGSRANLSKRGGRAVFRRATPFASPAIKSTVTPSRRPTQALRLQVIFKRSNMNA